MLAAVRRRLLLIIRKPTSSTRFKGRVRTFGVELLCRGPSWASRVEVRSPGYVQRLALGHVSVLLCCRTGGQVISTLARPVVLAIVVTALGVGIA